MSKKVANSQHYKVGIVTEVQGESLYATNPQGEVRRLSLGSTVYSDDKIESRDGSSMVVQASNGQTINIPEDVYDQLLSSAITKELSSALDASHEAQTADQTEPHSNNHPTQPADHSLNTIETPEFHTLKLNDLLCTNNNHPLNQWLDNSSVGVDNSISFSQLYSLNPFDIGGISLEDLSSNLFIG